MTVLKVSKTRLAVEDPSDAGPQTPRDKSLTHRAIIFGALAKGTTVIHEPLLGEDCLATAAIMSELGVAIAVCDGQMVVTSNGLASLAQTSRHPLDCGNSGTTARLLLGLFGGIEGFTGTMVGDASLSRRPMARVTALIDEGSGTRYSTESHLPITISGKTPSPRSFEFTKASGQVKSALLLHSLGCNGLVTIRLPAGGRDHTERFLASQGANISVATDGGDEVISFTGPFTPKAGEWRIPADPSSLAFLWVAGLTAGDSPKTYRDVLANPTRIGGLRVLQRMVGGLKVSADDNKTGTMEPTLTVHCPATTALKPTDITASELPTLIDEIPILAVAACFADGTSRFADLGELRVKESDRLMETHRLLSLAGAKAAIESDDLVIHGSLGFEPKPFSYHSTGDHRMVMAAAVLAASCPTTCMIADYKVVGTSFPSFASTLANALSRADAPLQG